MSCISNGAKYNLVKTMKEAVLMKEVWVPSESAFHFTEKVDPATGQKRYILKGLMLPFDKVSRNNVLYNKDSVVAKHKELIGKPLMYNHLVDGVNYPKGHFIDSYIESDGWHYVADVDPEEQDLIRKLKRGDLRHVSIQLIGGKVQERLAEDGRSYTEAWVSDIIEGSIVPAPGFLDTTASFAEALNIKKEDVSTTTASGAVAPTQPTGGKGYNGACFDDIQKLLAAEIDEDTIVDTIKKKYDMPEDLIRAKIQIAKRAMEFVRALGTKKVAEMLREQLGIMKTADTQMGELVLQANPDGTYIVQLGGKDWTYKISDYAHAEELFNKIKQEVDEGTVSAPFTYS